MKLHFVHFLSYIHFNSVDVHIKQCFKWWGQCMYRRSGFRLLETLFKATEPSVWEEQPVRGGSMNWGGGSTKAQYETNKDYIELSYKAAVAFRE